MAQSNQCIYGRPAQRHALEESFLEVERKQVWLQVLPETLWPWLLLLLLTRARQVHLQARASAHLGLLSAIAS